MSDISFFHTLVLAVYTRSPSAFRALKSLGILQLPSERSLKQRMNETKKTVAINEKDTGSGAIKYQEQLPVCIKYRQPLPSCKSKPLDGVLYTHAILLMKIQVNRLLLQLCQLLKVILTYLVRLILCCSMMYS